MFLQKVSEKGDWVEVRITKDVLSENLAAFKAEMYTLGGRSGLTVVLNFESVAQICSRALGIIAFSAWRFRQNGAALKVSNLTPNLQRIFKYARLDQSMALKESRPVEEFSRAAVAA